MKAVFFVFLVLATVTFCVDLDGDGFDTDPAFGRYQDCCDSVLDGCFDPYMVNPGAFEIPNNGILDRCVFDCSSTDGLTCQLLDEENLPCDYKHVNAESYVLSGPQITAPDTEPAIWAMDICEFKDDDDDPSWGFYRQLNMVFALADETRNGFDIGIIGPDTNQASVLRSFGRIGPLNGEFMTVMSTGIARAAYNPSPNAQTTGASYDAVSDDVALPTIWTSNPGTTNNFLGGVGCQKPNTATAAIDSILARYTMVQPSNMGAFSFKVLYLDTEITAGTFTAAQCNTRASWFLAFKNGTYGVPVDGNFAIDQNNWSFNSFNPNLNYYTQCSDWRGSWPKNTCYDSEVHLEGTGFSYATNWIPVGTAALPKEVFTLKLMTFDQTDGNRDTAVLLDDFKVMSEPRLTHGVSGYITTMYGYQYTGDIALVSLLPDVKGLYPGNTQTITLTYIVRNEGPEIAGDVTISFTPPFGTSFNSTTMFTECTKFAASGGFVDNSFYKCKLNGNAPLLPHATLTGTVVYNVLSKAPKDLQFRVTATTSSIDNVWGNNHLIQLVYIDKGVGL